jgi:hypothetical protein
MLTGFHNMHQHYLQFMPLFSILQGLMTQLLGVGLFQVRFLPVCLGTLGLALVFSIARMMGRGEGRVWAGPTAALLLCLWQWMPEGSHINLASGVPWLDLSRLARYDLLAAVCGLGALWCFGRARQTQKYLWDWACGGCIGLSGLSHIYGLFWLPMLGVALLLNSATRRHAWAIGLRIGAMVGVLLLPWAIFVFGHLNDAIAQARVNATRFEIFNPWFYLNNMLNERRRYLYGLGSVTAWLRPGVYSLLLLVPLAWLYQLRRASVARRHTTIGLVCTSAGIPLLFAAVLQPKTYQYLPTPASLMVIVVALMLADALATKQAATRVLAGGCLVLLCGFGIWGIWQMHSRASQRESPTRYFDDMQRIVPPSIHTRILALPNHWLAFPSYDYRNFVLVFYRSMPTISPNPVSFEEALVQVAPDVIILDKPLIEMFGSNTNPTSNEQSVMFWRYMRWRNARLVGTLHNNWDHPIEVYWLDPAPKAGP